MKQLKTQNNIKKFDHLTKNKIRNNTSSYLNNFLHNNKPLTTLESNLLNKAKSTKNIFNNNSDILLTRSDKRNTTVAIQKIITLTKLIIC